MKHHLKCRCIANLACRSNSYRLSLETLEDRIMPAPLSGALPVPPVSLAYNNVNATPLVTNAFVSDLYEDVLFRIPDSAGSALLNSALNKGGLSGGGAFAILLDSAEFKSTVNSLLTMYQAYLARPADLNGVSAWMGQVRQGASLGQIATAIAQSSEFRAQNGDVLTLSSDGFVTFLYQSLFRRAPDPPGAASWKLALDSGQLKRGDLLLAFLQAPEFAAKQPQVASQNLVTIGYLGLWNRNPDSNFGSYVAALTTGSIADAATLGTQFINHAHYLGIGASRNFVIGLYEGLLRREPELAGYRAWRSMLINQTMTDRDVYAAFLKSAEFQSLNQPVEMMYNVYLGRSAAPDGLSAALAQARNGVSLEQIALGVASSPEFQTQHGDVLSQSPAKFVTFLYQTVLRRTPSYSEVAFWAGQLTSAQLSRGRLLVQFLRVPEFQTANANLLAQNMVSLSYQTLLGRTPTPAEQTQGTSLLIAGNPSANLAAQLLTSPEFTEDAFRQNVQHYVVIYQENWSFDSLYGKFPGADGLANAGPAIPQVDKNGKPLTVLPQPLDEKGKPDSRFPANLAVAPYDLTKYVPVDQITGDLIHAFYTVQLQIDGGKIDKFVTWSNNGGLVLSYVDATNLPVGKLAQQYVLADNFFQSAFAGSLLNHLYLIAAAPGVWPNAPASLTSNPDPKNLLDRAVSPDGFLVNNRGPVNQPHNPAVTDPQLLVPEQTNPTIGDRLTEKNISWKWYSGGWNDALAGDVSAITIGIAFGVTQPFTYYKNYGEKTAGRAAHLKDEQDFFSDMTAGNLPAVSFVKPILQDTEHPATGSLLQGQQHVAKLVSALQNSSSWQNTAVIIAYDENGGRWDHVAPPVIDRFGPGNRVPAIVISPFAKRGFIDHTQYETVSITKTIEQVHNLAPLAQRDTNAGAMFHSYSFSPTDVIRFNG